MSATSSYKAQIEQVIECLKAEKTRKTALDILLSVSESKELVDIFLELEVPKLMVRMVESEDIKEKETVLQILINLSANEKYINSFVSLNTFHRVIKIVFAFLDSMPKKEEKTFSDPNDIMISNDILLDKNGNTFDIKMEMDKYVINSSTIENQHPELKNDTLINLFFMFMANLSSFEEGQKKLLDISNEKIKGIVFFKLLDKFFDNIYSSSFDFCSSVIANVSSLKEGRELILENKIFKIFLIQFDKMNNMKIVNILRMIRNCCFEYEKYSEELLVKDSVMFSYLIKVLLLINDKEKGTKIDIDEIDIMYFNNFDSDKLTHDDKETINDLIIDIFLILTNHKEAVEQMKTKGLSKAIKVLETALKESNEKSEIDEKVKDRLLVIKNYLDN